jgi:hypothetical protein
MKNLPTVTNFFQIAFYPSSTIPFHSGKRRYGADESPSNKLVLASVLRNSNLIQVLNAYMHAVH